MRMSVDHLIINFKSVLMNHLACQGITPLHHTDIRREIRSISPKLGSCNSGLMDPEYSTGLQNILPIRATSEVNTSTAPLSN